MEKNLSCDRLACVCVFFYDTDDRIPLATNSPGLSLGVCACINFPVRSLQRDVCLHKMCAFASTLIITLYPKLRAFAPKLFISFIYSLIGMHFYN